MGYCGRYVASAGLTRKAFSYNKRTMDRANGAFLAVVALLGINKLRVINTLNSSPVMAASPFQHKVQRPPALPSGYFLCIIEYSLGNREVQWRVLKAKTNEMRS